MSEDKKNTVKEFILREFLPGAEADELTDSTPLIASGILDSLATMKLVTFLEKTFSITVAPHESDEENLGTLNDIVRLIEEKS